MHLDDNHFMYCRKDREFKVTIRHASHGDMNHLHQFLRGVQFDCPQETIQVLDVVLRQKPSVEYIYYLLLVFFSVP